MCGIIAVVRRPSDRQPPELAGLLDTVERVAAVIPSADPGGGGTPRQAGDGWDATRSRLDEAGKALDGVDRELHGAAGLACLLADPDGRARLDRLAAELERRVERLEAAIDAEAAAMPADALEAVNAALVGAKDGLWAIRRDRIASAAAVAALAGRRWRPTAPSRSPWPRWTGSRSAAATPPGSTCWSAGTASTWRRRTSLACSPSACATRSTPPVRCAPPAASSASSTRPPARSASWATTPAGCARRSPATSCCAGRWSVRRPARWCSRTPAGPASA